MTQHKIVELRSDRVDLDLPDDLFTNPKSAAARQLRIDAARL